MLIEFIYHFLSFDIAWIAGLIMSNLFLVFVFIAIIYIFTGGKLVLLGSLALLFNLWALNDLGNIFQWATFVGGFLSIHYLVKIFVLAFAEDDPKFNSKLIWVNEISGYVVWIWYNFYVVGF